MTPRPAWYGVQAFALGLLVAGAVTGWWPLLAVALLVSAAGALFI